MDLSEDSFVKKILILMFTQVKELFVDFMLT